MRSTSARVAGRDTRAASAGLPCDTGGVHELSELSIRRPFNWGGLIVGDSAAEIGTDLHAHAGVSAGRHHAFIPVRHAQDVEFGDDLADDEPIPPFEVDVTCEIAAVAEPRSEIELVLEVPSAQVSLGDAESELTFEVTPGRWLLQIHLEPLAHPERVRLRLSPASPVNDDRQ